ncbi:MFS transporter [Lapidilactobacillus bayanensis]|uniref:MFS transporter n=1 Tax=Lapidilactobacillus bayanensis TaxID=2485998 RepID=UPI0021F0792D|nr:MFS transporter [Lapidilactobacillus bayanensis]
MAQIAISLTLAVFAVIFHLFPAQYYPELIGLIIVLQMTDNFLSTTLTASLVELFPQHQLQQVNSLNQSISSVATFLAPILGSVIFSFVSLGNFALLEIFFELVALGMILLLHFDTNPNGVQETTANSDPNATTEAETEHVGIWQNFQAGFTFIWQQKLILVLMISSSALNFLFAAINVGEPFILVKVLRLSNSQYGLTESAFAVGMFLGGLLLSRLVLKKHPVVTSYLSLIIVGGLIMANALPLFFNGQAATRTIYYFLLNSILGGVLVFGNTPINTYMQQIIPPKMQGRFFSLSSTMSMILMPLGTLLYGALFDHFDARPLFIITGVIVVILSVGLLTVVTKRQLLPTINEEHIDASETQLSEAK